MPKFFYTIVLIIVLAWLGVFTVGAKVAPDSPFNIATFMLFVFIALGITLTALIFIFFNYKSSLFMNRHILFRRALKYGYFVSLYITGIFTMRAFGVATLINYLLFTALCFVIYKYRKSDRS
jgi:hypothetical protein